MKKFSVIIPCFRHADVLTRCIKSIQNNADWKEKEIIVVMDSYDSKAEKVHKLFPDITWTMTDYDKPQGAPAARNVGAKLATGDYLLFLDADSIVYPGAFRAWAEAFEDHPDCGFVYSGYKIAGAQAYPSEPLDLYQLEQNNYIDTSNPLKKEVFLPWDESLKSLQDWHFWLQIVKSGVKGHFLENTYFVEKDPPGEGSISSDSDKNWLDRKRAVQKKLGLPRRDVAMTAFAGDHHAKRCAKLLDFDYVNPVFLGIKPHEYKAIYLVGSFPTNENHNIMPFMNLRVSPPKRLENFKWIRHWIGTDILQMKGIAFGTLKTFVDGLNKDFIHYCQTDENKKELEEIGLKVKTMPLPVDTTKNGYLPCPDKFTVSIYDHGQNQMYNQPLMVEVIRAMPDINFITFGNPNLTGKPKDLKNLEFFGHRPISEIINKTNVLLRITNHDGFPVSPVEFLCAGRAVIINHEFPYMEQVEGNLQEAGLIFLKKAIMKKIRRVKRNYPNQAFFEMARTHYGRVLNPKRLRNEILKCL